MKKFIVLALTTSVFIAIWVYRHELDQQIEKYTGYAPFKFLNMKFVLMTDQAFVKRVDECAQALNCPAEWLIAGMYIESSLSASAVNKVTGASGLIQFMPSTVEDLGTNIEEVRAMSAVEQMDLVELYLGKYSKKFTQFIDLYLSIFYPAAVGKGDDYIIGVSAGSDFAHRVANANPGYDVNKDGEIMVSEIKQVLKGRLEKAGFNNII